MTNNKARHQCMIYQGLPFDNLPRLVPTLLTKLMEKNRCIVLGSPTVVARMQGDLVAAGLAVTEAVKNGSLILSSSRDHLRNGIFNADQMLDMLKGAVSQALAEGYQGLWATGDMTWEFGGEENLKKLMEYECGLEALFRTTPELSGVCQYHMDTLPLDIIGSALHAHQSVYISHTLQRISPYYMQPEALKGFKPRVLERRDIAFALRESANQN